ncbi:hypothetical protein P168DRAFT_320545 [Aspergillus campestris IBT 28561]|uniref:Zn(2)-C6 fungal-type domain-containing protein n=1 Tax=Aspergillus campestris (strain IBT 28561) TaxID=1392248 RepID=A0A2I1CWH3_ASPC2|nr:uncharacterized protein P168DRAFT_320545 [Aspergillus campestris IBT 28561]PKY01976.1 hypothetical protein P168DRAFT_320545 [Aspergillus campestris IBT 28561]
MPAVLESMTSTPNSQSLVMDPSADKKRNKLGYHRTSVACVHCRRRKIRCLVAAGDAQGRCENCIRLRKECQFYPVDQQPPVEKKSRPNSQLESASTDPSTASSSPPPVGGGGSDQPDAFFPYPPMPLSSGPDGTTFNPSAFAADPMASFVPGPPVGSAEFTAAPPLDPSVPWDEFTTISDPQLLANMAGGKQAMMNSVPPAMWSPPPNAMAPVPAPSTIPSTPTVPSQTQALSPASTYTLQPDGSVWQIPPRSMPFAAPPDMTAQPYPRIRTRIRPCPRPQTPRDQPAQSFTGGPVHPQSPPPSDLPTAVMSVSYPGQPTAVGFPGWPDVHGMSSMNMVQYPMFAGDPSQQPPFNGGPPMGHGHPGASPG